MSYFGCIFCWEYCTDMTPKGQLLCTLSIFHIQSDVYSEGTSSLSHLCECCSFVLFAQSALLFLMKAKNEQKCLWSQWTKQKIQSPEHPWNLISHHSLSPAPDKQSVYCHFTAIVGLFIIHEQWWCIQRCMYISVPRQISLDHKFILSQIETEDRDFCDIPWLYVKPFSICVLTHKERDKQPKFKPFFTALYFPKSW